MSRLKIGKCYEYEDWCFLVVRELSEISVQALALTDYTTNRGAGKLISVHHASAVSALAQELA